VSSSVAQGAFKYYHYTVSPGTQVRLSLTVNTPPSSSSADADVYVKKGSQLPSRSDYDWAHMGTQRTAIIDIPAATSTSVYTIGVYGYTTVSSFTMTVNRAGSNCPGDCSGRGTCNQATATCTCNTGWYGRACNETVALGPVNVEVPEHMNRGTWKYYYIVVPDATTSLQVIVEQTSLTGDVDLYIKKGSVPSFSSFDYADSSTNRRFNITITSPVIRASYYLGFYGYFETNFKWQAVVGTNTRNCPNQCSGPTHGTCLNSRCQCAAGFSGNTCNQMTSDLQVYPTPQTVQGHVDANEWNYYSVTPHTTSPLTINVSHVHGQDCDVYVQRDRNPTRFDFLYRDITYDPTTTLTITNPLDSTWKIGVMGYAACDYTISASVAQVSICPAQCTNNGGSCAPSNPNVCVCPQNKAGQFCQYPVTRITSAQSITASIAPNSWAYYRFDGPASAFSIVLNEDLPSHRAGVLWLYASVVQAPTLTNYDWSDTATGTNTHRINVEIGQFIQNAHYYIGVYASPFAINSQNPYKISTWAAPFKK
jgi:hypothetical protein